MSEDTQERFGDLIGLTVAEAKAAAEDRGIAVVRPTVKDGRIVLCTRDYRLDRLNVTTKGGLIETIGNIG